MKKVVNERVVCRWSALAFISQHWGTTTSVCFGCSRTAPIRRIVTRCVELCFGVVWFCQLHWLANLMIYAPPPPPPPPPFTRFRCAGVCLLRMTQEGKTAKDYAARAAYRKQMSNPPTLMYLGNALATPKAPTAPKLVKATATSLTVNWSPPPHFPATPPVLKYEVSYGPKWSIAAWLTVRGHPLRSACLLVLFLLLRYASVQCSR